MVEKGLIIRKPWLDKIFQEGKRWEMRSTRTKVRGLIKLIESGSGLIVGECEISGCHKIDDREIEYMFCMHQVDDVGLLKRWCWAWELANVKKYNTPIPYQHPRGAVIWVNLNKNSLKINRKG